MSRRDCRSQAPDSRTFHRVPTLAHSVHYWLVTMRAGGRLGLHTSSDVREKWTKGEHLANNPALSKLGGLRWAMLDPVGTPRTTLRRVLNVKDVKVRVNQVRVQVLYGRTAQTASLDRVLAPDGRRLRSLGGI